MGRKSKFSDAQIIGFIKEMGGGLTGAALARREGVSTETVSRWRAKYGGMSVTDAQDKRRLEDENRKLRGLVAQYALEMESMKVALGKKW
jgi:putative transposase